MTAPHERKHGHFLPEGFPAPIRALAATSRALAVVEGIGIGIALGALVFLALWQLITRNLRMHGYPQVPAAPEWSDNVLRHSVFLIGFLGAMYATFTARHLRVDAMTRLAGEKKRLVMRAISALGAIVVCGFIVYAAWEYRNGVLDETPVEGQIFTPARGAMMIVLGITGVLFHLIVQFVIDLTYIVSKREVPDWWIAEATHGGEVDIAEEVADDIAAHDASPTESTTSEDR